MSGERFEIVSCLLLNVENLCGVGEQVDLQNCGDFYEIEKNLENCLKLLERNRR